MPVFSRKYVLLAEDSEDDYVLFKEILSKTVPGMGLARVRDGQALLDYLLEHQLPDLVVLDLNMPGMDGRAALREIRSNPAFRTVPVVVFSVSDNDEDRLVSTKAGCDAYFKKPSDYGALIQAVVKMEQQFLKR
ncbi:MAG TPA: response regulator [Candidatus Eisenbacteria bacterium]|nr:response regulator [Candidatus Eisenbacteria bacterium]